MVEAPPPKKTDISIDDIKKDIMNIAKALANQYFNNFKDKHAELIKFANSEVSRYNPSLHPDPQKWYIDTIDAIVQMIDLDDMEGGKLHKTNRRKTKRRKSNNRKKSKKSKRRKHRTRRR